MEEEIWKDIPNYEGLYQASNLGRIKRVERVLIDSMGRKYLLKEQILKGAIHNGYHYVRLSKNGTTYESSVHHLIGLTFLSNPNNLPQIGHKDETRDNNCVDNLEWVTAKDNCNMPLYKERISGENNSFYGKKHNQETKEKISKNHADFSLEKHPRARKVICENIIFNTITECANYYCVQKSHLCTYLKHSDTMPLFWKEKGLTYYKEEL